MALTILGMGIVTFLIRFVPIRFFTRIDMPDWALQAMRYVPVAVLTAIIVPEVLRPTGAIDISIGNARLFSALVAAVVAWRTRNVFITVAAGMVVLWIMRMLLAS